jgi:hypothetical protein
MNTCEGCRCYARSDSTRPKEYQFCGKQIGAEIHRCPERCCPGGCPGDHPKHPYRVVDVKEIRGDDPFPYLKIVLILLVVISTMFMA